MSIEDSHSELRIKYFTNYPLSHLGHATFQLRPVQKVMTLDFLSRISCSKKARLDETRK